MDTSGIEDGVWEQKCDLDLEYFVRYSGGVEGGVYDAFAEIASLKLLEARENVF